MVGLSALLSVAVVAVLVLVALLVVHVRTPAAKSQWRTPVLTLVMGALSSVSP